MSDADSHDATLDLTTDERSLDSSPRDIDADANDQEDDAFPQPCGLLGVPCPTGFYCKAMPLLAPMQVTREYCQSITEDAVYVPPGNFWLGANRVTECQWWRDPQIWCQPQSGYDFGYRAPLEVTTPAYVIQRKYATQAEFTQCVDDEPPGCMPNKMGPEWADYPASWITPNEASAYCAWLAKSTGRPWRLCTNAEWEKAARGGCETLQEERANGTNCRDAMRAFPWGNDIPPCGFAPADFGSWCRVTPLGYTSYPLVSEDFPASISPYGALDMYANMSTSVADCAHEPKTATLGPTDGSAWLDDCLETEDLVSGLVSALRMNRGYGGCGNPFAGGNESGCTVSIEDGLHADEVQNLVGVRCCRSFEPDAGD